MATPQSPEQQTSPEIVESFVADRAKFWGSFTKFVTGASVAIVVLLVLMAYFLV